MVVRDAGSVHRGALSLPVRCTCSGGPRWLTTMPTFQAKGWEYKGGSRQHAPSLQRQTSWDRGTSLPLRLPAPELALPPLSPEMPEVIFILRSLVLGERHWDIMKSLCHSLLLGVGIHPNRGNKSASVSVQLFYTPNQENLRELCWLLGAVKPAIPPKLFY